MINPGERRRERISVLSTLTQTVVEGLYVACFDATDRRYPALQRSGETLCKQSARFLKFKKFEI
jgi:hypothetical protein